MYETKPTIPQIKVDYDLLPQIERSECGRCGGSLAWQEHDLNWLPKEGQRYMFLAWQMCVDCGAMWLHGELKIEIDESFPRRRGTNRRSKRDSVVRSPRGSSGGSGECCPVETRMRKETGFRNRVIESFRGEVLGWDKDSGARKWGQRILSQITKGYYSPSPTPTLW